MFSHIAWYYGDSDFIISTLFPMHIQTQHTWLAVPDKDSHMTCSTDTDSDVTCIETAAESRLSPIDFHSFTRVRYYDKMTYCRVSINYQENRHQQRQQSIDSNKLWVRGHMRGCVTIRDATMKLVQKGYSNSRSTIKEIACMSKLTSAEEQAILVLWQCQAWLCFWHLLQSKLHVCACICDWALSYCVWVKHSS